ncbi:MAG: hypothetical protein WC527_06100 [Candidatus Margulisiibacteriota bacterium]
MVNGVHPGVYTNLSNVIANFASEAQMAGYYARGVIIAILMHNDMQKNPETGPQRENSAQQGPVAPPAQLPSQGHSIQSKK